MTQSRHKSRFLLGFIALLFAVLLSFVTWVVTDSEFQDARGRTLIERWEDAVSSRLGQTGNIFRQVTGKDRKKSKSTDKKPDVVTGPASVLVFDRRNSPVRDVAVAFRAVKGGKVTKEKTSSKGRVDTKLPLGSYQISLTHPKYSTEVRAGNNIVSSKKGFSLNVVLDSKVKIKGLVVNEEGKAVPEATVTGQRNWLEQFSGTGATFLDDAAYPTVTVDKNGKFTLPDISIGDNTIVASAKGFATVEKRMSVPAGGTGKELKLVLGRPGKITGRVVDEDMKPVPKVKVSAATFQPYGETESALPEKGFVTATDAGGNFTLSKLYSQGYYRLRFENTGYAVMEMAHVTADTNGLTMVLQRGGEISGTVEYIDRPTTTAYVMVQAQAVLSGTTVTRTVMSAASGNFQFQQLPYGSYNLSVDYNGFVNEPGKRVLSAKDKPSVGNVIEIFEASYLSGRVEDAFSNEAIGEAKVIVRASYGFTKPRVRQIVKYADSSGNYSFDKIPGGAHQLTAESDGYLPVGNSLEENGVALDPGERIKDRTVFLSKGGTVKGRVVASDGNGIGDSEVQLYVASGSFSSLKVKDLTQKTDGSGYFEFRDFPIGQSLSIYISGRKEGFAKKNSDLVELTPQQPEAYTNVVLTPGGVVSGQVEDTDGTPLYGVKVTIDSREFPRDPSPTEFYTFTDIQGNYLLEHCTPGRAILVADHDDYVRNTRSANIPEGRLLSRQNFKLQKSYTIRGVVADFRGHPIAGARVRAAPISPAKGSGIDTTDKKGDFEIRGLGDGKFRLEASFNLDTADGKQSYVFILPEASTGSSGIPIDCDVAPTALGKVYGNKGKGVENFTLTLRSRLDTNPKQQFRFNIVRKYNKAGGSFRLLQIPRGLYKLKIESPGYETWESDEIIVGPGNRTHLPSIRLKPSSQIVGTVISSTTGKAVHQALVRVLDEGKEAEVSVNRIELAGYNRSDIIEYLNAAYDDDVKYDPDPNTRLIARVRNNVVTTLRTNIYGKFSIDDLGNGRYTLEIEHPSYRPKRILNVYAGREDQKDLGDVELEPGGTIKGRVVDLEGNGITATAVEVKGELQGRNRARTDSSGNFVLHGIGFGEWPISVLATLDGRKIYAWKKINVRPDETTFVEFVLETSADVNGRINLPDGVPKSGTVRLYTIDETGTVYDDISYTDNLGNGRYNITKIPPGRYFLLANGKGSRGDFAFWQWIDVNRGRNSINLNTVDASMRGVAANVLGGEPVSKAHLQMIVDVPGVIVPAKLQNILKLNTTANAKGAFSFPYLQDGIYRIWAAGPGSQLKPVDAVPIGAGQAIKGYTLAVQADSSSE